MAVKFQLRRDTAANWTAANTVLDLGEPGVETDTLKLKIGDGVTPWNSLDYSITREFSELANIPTTLAGYGITDAATSAQGALADTALQPGDGLSGAFTGDVTGSVFADDSTVMIDGVAATVNLANNSITDLPDADQTLQTSDIVEFAKVFTSSIDSSDSSAIVLETDVEMLAGLTVGNHIIPSSTLSIDLGSSTKRFRDIYLSGETIDLGGVEIKRSGAAVQLPAGSLIEGQNPISAPDQDLNTTDDVTFNNITTTGYIAGPATFTIDPAAIGDNTGVVVIAGDLQVDGTTTTINSTTVEVGDKNIVLGADATADTQNNGAGITVSRPDSTDATITWNETTDQWTINKAVNIDGDTNITGNLDLAASTTETKSLQIGHGRTGDGISLIDLVGDTTYSDYGFRIQRTGTSSGKSSLLHKGTGNLEIRALDAAAIKLETSNLDRIIIASGGDVQFYENNSGTPRAAFHWDYTDGHLGIGSTTPSYPIDVEGSNILARFGETAGNNSIVVTRTITNPSSLSLGAFTNQGVIKYSGSAGFKFTNDDTTSDDLVIREDGNVGIGVTNPTSYWAGGQRLVVGTGTGDQGMSILAGTASKSSIAFADGTGTGGYRGRIEYDHNTDSFAIGTSGTTPITIDSNNNIGFGAAPNNYADFVSLKLSDTTGGVIEFADDDVVVGEVFNTADDFFVGTTKAGADVVVRTDAGTEAARFDSTQNLTVAQNSIANNHILAAIDKDLSDTAVDVLVYDTSLDSDNGNWRYQTQDTSWYNETLNTATRGSRKEFPSVAIIVAEDDKVTIYDADDPDLPMWMIFNAGGGNGEAMIGRTNEATTAIAMLNGVLCVGRNSFGLHIINFVSDKARFKEKGYDTPYLLPIGTNRNSGNSWVTVNEGNDLIDDTIRDVAMKVLPNAPIDPYTGIQVPTIAVVTAAGISVVKDDGTVVDDATYDGNRIAWTPDNKIVTNAYVNFSPADRVYVLDYPVISGLRGYYESTTPSITNEPQVNNGFHNGIATSPGRIYGANYVDGTYTHNPLTIIDYDLNQSQTTDMVCYIASDYNTGWLPGNTKLATLSTTSSGTIISSELVTNGTFDTDIAGWTGLSGATLSFDTNRLKIEETTGAVDAYAVNSSAITTEIGKRYIISWQYITGTNTGFATRFGTSGQQSQEYKSNINQEYADGFYKFEFVATATTLWLSFIVNEANTYGFVDNISVRVAEEDRSVNQDGVQVIGSISRTPVETTADLIAYGNFSTSNYLQQPYDAINTTIDVGTGDFTMSIWAKADAFDTYNTLMAQWRLNQTDAAQFSLETVGSKIFFYVVDGGSFAYAGGDTTLVTGAWYHFTVTRISGVITVYINGEAESTTLAYSGDLTARDDPLSIGVLWNTTGFTGGAQGPWNGSLTLARFSSTGTSAEKVLTMYKDEKAFFQEGAQSTLYGTPDKVTALSYDNDTNLLHVGTSAGRSVFQGLRRVDNTTDAVTNAISASNGLVAEE